MSETTPAKAVASLVLLVGGLSVIYGYLIFDAVKPVPVVTKVVKTASAGVYDITAYVKNEGNSGTVVVKAKLVAENGEVRDEITKDIYIGSGQTVKVHFTLQGDFKKKYAVEVAATAKK